MDFYGILFDNIGLKLPIKSIAIIIDNDNTYEIKGEDFQSWLKTGFETKEPFQTSIYSLAYEMEIPITLEIVEQETSGLYGYAFSKKESNTVTGIYYKEKTKCIKISSDELYDNDEVEIRYYTPVPKDGKTFKWRSADEINTINDAISNLITFDPDVNAEVISQYYLDGLFSLGIGIYYSNISQGGESIINMPPILDQQGRLTLYIGDGYGTGTIEVAGNNQTAILARLAEGFPQIHPIFVSSHAITPITLAINRQESTIEANGYVYAPQGIGIGADTYISVDPNKDGRLSLANLTDANFYTNQTCTCDEVQILKGALGTLSMYIWVDCDFDTSEPPTLKATPLSRGKSIQGIGAKATELLTTEPKKPLAECTWAEIDEISKSGKASEYFAIGDEKDIELSTGEVITMVIIGFDHDDLSDGSGKACITFGMKNCLATKYKMNSSSLNAGGWKSSQMRTSTMETLYGLLPPEVKAVIKPVDKKTSAGSSSSTINTTSDKLFLFSQEEVMGTINYTTTGQNSFSGEGSQYEYFKNAPIPKPTTGTAFSELAGTGCFYTTDTAAVTGYINKFGESKSTSKNYYYNYNNAKAGGNTGKTAVIWWLRSPYFSDSSAFCCISYTGYSLSGYANGSTGVAFGFCV